MTLQAHNACIVRTSATFLFSKQHPTAQSPSRPIFTVQHFLNDITFLFIDNFDAFYPFETAKGILQKIKKFKFQTVVTTHNTGLLSHKIIRPDVCFVMKSGILTSFPNLTDRELREGNNLEKLYLSGEFDA